MRVALGTAYPLDESRIFGGVEAVAYNLAQALAATGQAEVHVVSLSERVPTDSVEQRGPVSIHWLRVRPGLGTLKALTTHARRVAAAYASFSPDIIHAQGFSAYAVGAPDACPVVLTVHGLEWFSPTMSTTPRYAGLAGAYRRWAERRLILHCVAKSAAVVSIAGPFAPTLMGPMLGSKIVRCIPNPLVTDSWISVSPHHDDGRTVLCVGLITSRKNQMALIRTFARIADEFPDSRLRFAGAIDETKYMDSLRREVDALDLGRRVAFLGQLNDAELLGAYAEAAVVACPSVMETAPMALAEAMASARAVLATRAGAIPWMLDEGASGYLVEINDTEEMAAGLRALLSDTSLRWRLGDAARERATQLFESGAVAAQTVALYRDLLA